MGGVGDFIFGGNTQKNKSQNTSSSDSSSASNQSSNSASQNTAVNQSVNQSYQGSGAKAVNKAGSGSYNANQAYGTLSSALDPSLGYVQSAGNMLGALLGLTPVSVKDVPYHAPNITPNVSVPNITLPPITPPPGYGVPPTAPAPVTPPPGAVPTPTPTPTPVPTPAPAPGGSPGDPGSLGGLAKYLLRNPRGKGIYQ